MSSLKPGALCVIVGGCPKNIGLIVKIIAHIGPLPPRADAYSIKTASGRNFHQLWTETGSTSHLARGYSNTCITDRHKLRPLVDSKDEPEVRNSTEDYMKNLNDKLAACQAKPEAVTS